MPKYNNKNLYKLKYWIKKREDNNAKWSWKVYYNNDDDDRFTKWLTNDWIHLERKVAALEAKMHLLLGASGILIGLMVYAVTQWKF